MHYSQLPIGLISNPQILRKSQKCYAEQIIEIISTYTSSNPVTQMRTNFVLVDYENVQPKDLSLLKDGPFNVKIFLGPNQSKIPVTLASALQPLGNSVE